MLLVSPSSVGVPVCVLVSPFCCVAAPLNGGSVGWCVVPLSRVVLPPSLLILAPLLSVCCCGVLWAGKCGGVCRGWHDAGDACLAVWCVWWRSEACPTPFRIVQPPFSLCVCCHSIVGLGLCLCDRVVSLWNSGGGLCWVEGCVVSTVYTSFALWCASQWCVCCDGSV